MNEIVIKKSELLTMKYGLGKSNDEIALKYNISKKEAIDALETFGLIKKRTGASTAKYTIRLMDDIAEINKVEEDVPQMPAPEVNSENNYSFEA